MPASMESLHCRDCSPQYAGGRSRTGMGLGRTPAAPGIFSHAKCHAASRTIICSVKDRGVCSQNKRRIKWNRDITSFCRLLQWMCDSKYMEGEYAASLYFPAEPWVF